MESVLEFLEGNDNKWEIDFGRYTHLNQIAERFGHDYKTAPAAQESLINKIKEVLHGEDVNQEEFNRIQQHLALRYYTSNRLDCNNAFRFIDLLKYAINNLNSYTNSCESWILARDYLEAYLSISPNKPGEELFFVDENKKISESIQFLRKRGYRPLIQLGQIELSPEDEARLLQSINYRFQKTGYNSICFTLKCISDLYNTQMGRFFLRDEPKSTGDIQINIPWGYIFNISLSHLHPVKKSRDHLKKYTEGVELSRHFFCIKRLQTLSKYSDIYHQRSTIVSAIQKNILYDQHFSIDQISTKHIQKIVSGIFSSNILDKYKIDINPHLDILRLVSRKSNHDCPLIFNEQEIFKDLSQKYSSLEIKSALDILTQDANKINKEYLQPNDIKRRNYFERPFFLYQGKYIYINPVLNNYGFYATILKIYTENGADGHAMGIATEEFVGRLFTEHGILVHSNKKYKITKQVAGELSIKSKEKEVDFIIETNDTIIFIELKRKTLTSEARAGNSLKSLLDLSQSLLQALVQSGCHEYVLRRDGLISFEDGSQINLSNRKIERVALSLFGFFGLQDGVFSNQIIRNLIDSTVSSDEEKEVVDINKTISELRNQYKTIIFIREYGKQMNPFFNCRFFSVPQLIEILSNSRNNEEFKIELNRTRHVSTGCKDWFKDYYFIRQLNGLN